MHTVEFLKVAAYIIIFGFFWRVIAARLADKPIGQAMGYIY
jgi:hypothetical protein